MDEIPLKILSRIKGKVRKINQGYFLAGGPFITQGHIDSLEKGFSPGGWGPSEKSLRELGCEIHALILQVALFLYLRRVCDMLIFN